MSRKRPKNKAKVRPTSPSEVVSETAEVEALVEDEILAEGSGPHEVLAAAIDEAAAEIAEHYAAPPNRERERDGDGEESHSDEVAAMADALEAVADHAVPTLSVVEDPDLDPDAPHDLEASALPDGEEVELADGDAATLPTSAGSMEPGQLKLLVEALVFAADKPLTIQRLRQLTRIADTQKLEDTLLEIQSDYSERGLILSSVSGGWQFRTRPQFSAWVQQLIAGRPVRLSRAQLETLAIVAYRQPITRPEIDDIRGVDSSATLKLLFDRALVRVLGKKEEVGRPMLYGTTKDFLDFFSLADLRELPTLREYSELTDESRQVITNKLGPSDDGTGGSGSGGSGTGGSFGGEGGGMGGQGPLGDGSDGETPADGAAASTFDSIDGEAMYASGAGQPASSDDESMAASTDDEMLPALTDDDTMSGVSDDTMSSPTGDKVVSVASDDDATSTASDGESVATSLEEDTMSASLDDQTVSELDVEDEVPSASTADEDVSASTDAPTIAHDDALSRLAARMLASNQEPDAPDAELADGTGAVASLDEPDAEALEAIASEGAVESTDAEAYFASGSRAFTAVTDTDALELAANVTAEMARDDEGEPIVEEPAAPGMLVATDEIVDDDVPAEPSE